MKNPNILRKAETSDGHFCLLKKKHNFFPEKRFNSKFPTCLMTGPDSDSGPMVGSQSNSFEFYECNAELPALVMYHDSFFFMKSSNYHEMHHKIARIGNTLITFGKRLLTYE